MPIKIYYTAGSARIEIFGHYVYTDVEFDRFSDF
jgi:hypothetical protein